VQHLQAHGLHPYHRDASSSASLRQGKVCSNGSMNCDHSLADAEALIVASLRTANLHKAALLTVDATPAGPHWKKIVKIIWNPRNHRVPNLFLKLTNIFGDILQTKLIKHNKTLRKLYF